MYERLLKKDAVIKLRLPPPLDWGRVENTFVMFVWPTSALFKDVGYICSKYTHSRILFVNVLHLILCTVLFV